MFFYYLLLYVLNYTKPGTVGVQNPHRALGIIFCRFSHEMPIYCSPTSSIRILRTHTSLCTPPPTRTRTR